MSDIQILDVASIEEWIKNNDGLILFQKKLCPHCKVLGTVLTKVAVQSPELAMASVDSEEQTALLAQYNVERIPTLLACKGGVIAGRKSGVMNPRELLAFYEQA